MRGCVADVKQLHGGNVGSALGDPRAIGEPFPPKLGVPKASPRRLEKLWHDIDKVHVRVDVCAVDDGSPSSGRCLVDGEAIATQRRVAARPVEGSHHAL